MGKTLQSISEKQGTPWKDIQRSVLFVLNVVHTGTEHTGAMANLGKRLLDIATISLERVARSLGTGFSRIPK